MGSACRPIATAGRSEAAGSTGGETWQALYFELVPNQCYDVVLMHLLLKMWKARLRKMRGSRHQNQQIHVRNQFGHESSAHPFSTTRSSLAMPLACAQSCASRIVTFEDEAGLIGLASTSNVSSALSVASLTTAPSRGTSMEGRGPSFPSKSIRRMQPGKRS